MDTTRVILSSHLRQSTFVKDGIIVYNNFNDSFLLIRKTSSEYYTNLIQGKYRVGLLPIMIDQLLPKERKDLAKYIDGELFNNKGRTTLVLANRLIRDKAIINNYLKIAKSSELSNWELPEYISNFNNISKPLPETINHIIGNEDILWKSVNTIKRTIIMINRDIKVVNYHIIIIDKKIKDDNIKWINSLKDITKEEFETEVKKFIKISMNNTINISSEKINKGKYIKEYLGQGSYSVLESGHIIVIVNGVDDHCADLKDKLNNLAGIYGKYFRYHFLCYDNSKDLVIMIH